MQEYRAYVIAPDGRIKQRVDLACADDGEAKETAKQLVDGHDVELWQGARLVAVFRYRERSLSTGRAPPIDGV
jgi:hypothetical protein